MLPAKLRPDLRLLPIERVRFHERTEIRRTLGLMGRIRKEGMLRHPPIVADLSDGDFLLLDGANRATAFRELAYSHLPVQVIDYRSKAIELKGWHHLLLEARDLDLQSTYTALPGVEVARVQRRSLSHLLKERRVYAILVDETAKCWALREAHSGGPLEIHRRIEVLDLVVAAYEKRTKLERIKLADFSQIPEVVRSLEYQLCLFPLFMKEELLQLAEEGIRIPTGITRHLIPGRTLGLNLDLAFLREMETEEEKLRHFREVLEGFQREGRIRFYEESVFLIE